MAKQPELLLKDGVQYVAHEYADENELESALFEHVAEVFGPEALLFGKKLIKAKSGIGSVPDAFVLDLARRKWSIVEVELASHRLFDHVVGQVTKFAAAIRNSSTLSSLKRAFYDEITNEPDLRVFFERKGISEIYKTVSDVLDGEPVVEIVIDERSQELAEVVHALPFHAQAIEFRTYWRDGRVEEDHIHRFLPLWQAPLRKPRVGKDEPEVEAVEAGSERESVYWLTPVKPEPERSAEECVRILADENGIYAFGQRTPGRKRIKPGDWLCFYATGTGVVAHARVASRPEHMHHPAVLNPEQFPWVFQVDSVSLYLDRPVAIDLDLRKRLDRFSGRKASGHWAWFVQATHRVSENDFRRLTRQ